MGQAELGKGAEGVVGVAVGIDAEAEEPPGDGAVLEAQHENWNELEDEADDGVVERLYQALASAILCRRSEESMECYRSQASDEDQYAVGYTQNEL